MISLLRQSLPTLGFLSTPTFWGYLFCVLWLHRYVRLLVHCVSHWSYKSKPLPEKPTLTADDVTVIIPTIETDMEELRGTLESVMACRPAHFMLVTTTDKRARIEKLARSLNFPNIEVLSTHIANKRLQVCEALPRVRTKITVMADDDVTWPTTIMPWLLAPFEYDPRMGGVGTCQRVRRLPSSAPLSERIFNWLGAAYIERRNFEISATHNIDGGTSCMSGRTGAYRTEILSSQAFLEGIKTERWGKYILNADDDNFVTRFLVNNQWKTWIQYEPECQLETTLENNTKFLYQCTRWARSNWRSNWTSLVVERFVWTQQPWCTYALHMTTFSSLALLFDPLLLLSLWWGTAAWDPVSRHRVFLAQLLFTFGFSKTVKLVGLFRRNPSDLVYLPVSVIFGYCHGLIRLYALFTLRMTSWGSRPDGDTNDKARLTPRPMRSMSMSTPRGHADLIRFRQGVKAERDASLWMRAVVNGNNEAARPAAANSGRNAFPLDVKTKNLDALINSGIVPPLSPAKTAPLLGPSSDVPWREFQPATCRVRC